MTFSPDASDPAEGQSDLRLTELEVKLSFLEDLVEQLNEVITRHEDRIDLLVREVMRLRQQSAAAEPATAHTLREEIPPHY